MATNSSSTISPEKFQGQKIFCRALETQFPTCFDIILVEGFQTGWKRITQTPQHGNYNPNYADILAFIETVITNGYTMFRCPIFPVEQDLKEWRSGLSKDEQWRTMRAFCAVYRYFVNSGVKLPKRSGVISKLFNAGYIHHETTESDFDDLLVVAQNRFDAEIRDNV
jgi:hypothetical protein